MTRGLTIFHFSHRSAGFSDLTFRLLVKSLTAQSLGRTDISNKLSIGR